MPHRFSIASNIRKATLDDAYVVWKGDEVVRLPLLKLPVIVPPPKEPK